MSNVREACIPYMNQLCEFIVKTKDRGHIIKPNNPGSWDGTRNYLFVISGESDADYAKHLKKLSVCAGCKFLCGAMIKMFSRLMQICALSTTEAELNAAILEAMDMMLCYYIMRGLKLTVQLPMILYVDNSGAVALANNWSVAGRTRHMGVKQNYLRMLKENGFINVKYKKGTELIPDIATKNVTKAEYIKQSNKFMHPAMAQGVKGVRFE